MSERPTPYQAARTTAVCQRCGVTFLSHDVIPLALYGVEMALCLPDVLLVISSLARIAPDERAARMAERVATWKSQREARV